MRVSRVVFTALFLILSLNARAKVYTLGVESLCPYYCDDATRPGYIIELLDAFIKKQGDELKVTYLPFIRLAEFVKIGKINLTLLPQYEVRFDSELRPIGPTLGISYVGIVTDPKQNGPFIGVSDLVGFKTVIPKRGQEYDKIKNYFKAHKKEKSLIEITGEDSVQRQFKMLQLGRVELAVGDYNIFKYYIAKNKLQKDARLFATSIGGFHPITLVGSQSFEKLGEFERPFTQFLAEMRASNELGELLAKYNITDWQQLAP